MSVEGDAPASFLGREQVCARGLGLSTNSSPKVDLPTRGQSRAKGRTQRVDEGRDLPLAGPCRLPLTPYPICGNPCDFVPAKIAANSSTRAVAIRKSRLFSIASFTSASRYRSPYPVHQRSCVAEEGSREQSAGAVRNRDFDLWLDVVRTLHASGEQRDA